MTANQTPTIPESMRRSNFSDAIEVARILSPELPVFCFSPAQLHVQAKAFIEEFSGVVTYAVKANPAPYIIETLVQAGIEHWDVASLTEMVAVRNIDPKAIFHYHNPVKSHREISEAYTRFGCRRFAVDSFEELEKLADGIGASREECAIAVRFVLPKAESLSAHDFSSKFGASEPLAAELLQEASKLGFKVLLTSHPGSQCKYPVAYARYIEAAARIAKQADIRLERLNVGGGFPATYFFSQGAPLPDYFTAIKASAECAFGDDVPILECEPGRGLVAKSVSLLTKVKLVRCAKHEVFINDGVFGALMECYQVPELLPPIRVIRDGELLTGEQRPFTIFGPTCDPLDILPHQLSLPVDLREGDYIEFGTLGAYGIATSTRFNGYGAHETVEVVQTLNLQDSDVVT